MNLSDPQWGRQRFYHPLFIVKETKVQIMHFASGTKLWKAETGSAKFSDHLSAGSYCTTLPWFLAGEPHIGVQPGSGITGPPGGTLILQLLPLSLLGPGWAWVGERLWPNALGVIPKGLRILEVYRGGTGTERPLSLKDLKAVCGA